MNAKVRCCCDGESAQVARYLEVEPVISIPASSYILSDVRFFLDLGADFELSDDLELYGGGNASTAGIPILLGYLEVFVPNSVTRIFWPDNVNTNAGNLKEIYALKHRGWRLKDSGLKLTTVQMSTGDGVEGTRIILSKPTSGGGGIGQVQDDGFYFLGGTFSDTPALVEERTGVDNFGEPVTYFVGYNPRRECSRPEQGRYYGNDDRPRLLFDFTSEFPETITLTFTKKYRRFGNTSTPVRTVTFTKTYSKFVGGSATRQSIEQVDDLDGTGTYSNVAGFIEDDPEVSDLILFGYRAIDCTKQEPDPDRPPGDYITFSAPSMPVKYYSFGKDDRFFSGSNGEIKIASGDGGSLLGAIDTDEVQSGVFMERFLPHTIEFGAIMSDVSWGFGRESMETGVPTPPNDIKIAHTDSFGFTLSTGFRAGPPCKLGPCGSTNRDSSTNSYKGMSNLDSIHTFSLEAAYFQRSSVYRHRGYISGGGATDDYTIRNKITSVIGTVDFPAFALDSKTGSVALRNMTNPFGDAYHYLTDGLPSGCYFDLLSAVDTVTQS